MKQLPVRAILLGGVSILLIACKPEIASPISSPTVSSTSVVTAVDDLITTTPPSSLPDLGMSCHLFDSMPAVQCLQVATYNPDVAHQAEKSVTAHLQLALTDMALPDKAIKPWIGIYPIAAFDPQSDAPNYINQLRLLLTERPDNLSGRVPFFASGQVTPIHASPAYLDVKGSSGVRFVGQLSDGQSFIPITNETLFYGYQGVTNDNAFYIAAILPISHSALPMTAAEVTNYESILANSEQYLSESENSLTHDIAGYRPTIVELDVVLQNILQGLPIAADQRPLAISLAGFEPLDVNTPVRAENIKPGSLFSYWAIHQIDIGGTDTIMVSAGDKEQLSAAVQAQVEALLSPDCPSGERIPNYCFYYIITALKDGTVQRWQQPNEVSAFLGRIDTYQEAMLLAISQEYNFGPPGATGSYKPVADGFELIGLKMVSDCGPIQTDRVRIHVSYDGSISILQSEIFTSSDGCI